MHRIAHPDNLHRLFNHLPPSPEKNNVAGFWIDTLKHPSVGCRHGYPHKSKQVPNHC